MGGAVGSFGPSYCPKTENLKNMREQKGLCFTKETRGETKAAIKCVLAERKVVVYAVIVPGPDTIMDVDTQTPNGLA